MKKYIGTQKLRVTEERYREMLAKQDNCCGICGVGCDEIPQNLVIDHDHITEQIRGLLCLKCNAGLGMFSDSRVLLEKANKYLEKYQREVLSIKSNIKEISCIRK